MVRLDEGRDAPLGRCGLMLNRPAPSRFAIDAD
jgi:hypothetical protein